MGKRLDIAEQLRKAVKDHLKRTKESYFIFGASIGVNPAVISRFVTDDLDKRRDIRLETAAKLCKFLQLHLSPED